MVGGTRGRVFRRLQKILKRARPVAALLEMHGQFSRNFVGAITVNRHSAFGNALVNLRAAHWCHQPVRYIAIKNVNKPMPRSDSSIRQFHHPGRGQKLMSSGQFLAVLFDPFGRHVEAGSNGLGGTFHPCHAAPSSTLRSSGLSLSICFSISCRRFAGTPCSISDKSTRNSHDLFFATIIFWSIKYFTRLTMKSGLPSVRREMVRRNRSGNSWPGNLAT